MIISATLQLKVSAESAGFDLRLHRITSSWTESMTAAPTYSASYYALTQSVISGVENFDVKTEVQDLVTNGGAFYGWMIHCATENSSTARSYTYFSSEVAGSGPMLVISYYIPFSIIGATVTNASTTTSADGVISPILQDGSGSTTYAWTDGYGHNWTGSPLSGIDTGYYFMTATGAQGDKFYYAFVVGTKCDILTLPYFQPGPDFVDDAPVCENYVSNQGSNTSWISAYDNSAGAWRTTRTYIKFRLWLDQVLPVSAQLVLTGNTHSGTNNSLLQRVNATWNENTVVPINEPTTTGATVSSPSLSGSAGVTLDITGFWQTWRQNNLQNYGFKFFPDHPSPTVSEKQQFYSSDFTTVASRPKIKMIVEDAACASLAAVTAKSLPEASFTTTLNNTLNISFSEEYQINSGKKIPMKLYDDQSTLIAGIDINGSAISGLPLLSAINYTIGINQFGISLGTLGLTLNRMYLLEINTLSGDKKYVRFKYTN